MSNVSNRVVPEEELCASLNEVLYGVLSPDTFPNSMYIYLQLIREYTDHPPETLTGYLNTPFPGPPRFFRNIGRAHLKTQEDFPAFYLVMVEADGEGYPLTKFYDLIFTFEFRLIINNVLNWKEYLPETLLICETEKVFKRLLTISRECTTRLETRVQNSSYLPRNVWQKMRVHAGAALLELNERMPLSGLPEYDSQALNQRLFNTPGGEYRFWYPTASLLKHEVSRLNPEEITEYSILKLKERFLPEKDRKWPEQVMKERERIQRTLENMLLGMQFSLTKGAADLVPAVDDDLALSNFLLQQTEQLREGDEAVSARILKVIAGTFRVFKGRLPDVCSEAYTLFTLGQEWLSSEQAAPTIFNQPLPEKTDEIESSTKMGLIRIEELRENLGVSLVTLNKYLKESKTPVIRFSAKERWLDKAAYQHFLSYYREHTKDDE